MKHTSSLKWNTIANYIGLGYTTLIGIIILPFYLQYLGAEAFGLIGFFTVLQSWMQLFDMGMSPMLSRQTAQARGENDGFLGLKKLLRSLEIISLSLALIIALSIAAGSSWIANNWLKVTSLDLSEVIICIVLMGSIIGLRFFSSLYRSGIRGMEAQVSLNVANITLVTFKYIGALLLLRFITQDFVSFFFFQLFIGAVEFVVLVAMFYHYMPSTDKIGIRFFWDTLKPILPFAAGIAYTAVLWVILTQLDKLILSNILPLSQYGYFALVVIVATGIIKISAPVSQAILPRMTYLLSQGNEEKMLLLYRKSTQLMAVIVLPVSGVIAMFSSELLFAWTGDREAAEWAGPILFWFALGNGILAISAFQFYLQFAHGRLRMHVIYNSVSSSIQIPVIIYVAYTYGVMGVALTWFIIRLITFILWTPIVHHKFAPGIHWPWLIYDVAPLFITTTVLLSFINSMDIDPENLSRPGIFGVLLSIGIILVMVNLLVSSAGRELLQSVIRKASG